MCVGDHSDTHVSSYVAVDGCADAPTFFVADAYCLPCCVVHSLLPRRGASPPAAAHVLHRDDMSARSNTQVGCYVAFTCMLSLAIWRRATTRCIPHMRTLTHNTSPLHPALPPQPTQHTQQPTFRHTRLYTHPTNSPVQYCLTLLAAPPHTAQHLPPACAYLKFNSAPP